jgi:TPP-dependent pyruvate/acetoin dehydrogenase alpha subunit
MPRKKRNNSSNSSSRRAAKTESTACAAGTMPASALQAAVLDEQKLQHLYSSMLKCQMLYRIAQKASTHQKMLSGREAVLAGALAHTRRDDYVATAQNASLVGLLRGDTPDSILAQLFSQHAEANKHMEGSPGQVALIKAMGAARDLLGSGRITLAFCGEDAAALSFQLEALALAAKHKAPVVCLIETTLSRLGADDPSRGRKKKSGERPFPVIVVDGADVVAVFRVTQEAVRRARHGQGPSLIECVMPDEGSHDPLVFMEQYLRRKNMWSDEWQKAVADEFAAQLERALPSVTGAPTT